jgi:hypothetical protein
MARTTHLRSDADADSTLCGMEIASSAWSAPLEIADALLDAKKPCRDCARLDASREPVLEPEPDFVPSGPYSPSYGARELGPSARRALAAGRQERAEDGRGEAPRWPSSEAAVRSYVRARTEFERFGVPLRSSAAPSDRIQNARDASLGGREHAQMDRYRNVSLALDRAVSSASVRLAIAGSISLELGRTIFEWACAGRPRMRPTKQGTRELRGRVIEWLSWTHEEIAERVREERGLELLEADVTHVRRVFRGHVMDALLASGEIGERGEQREATSDAAAARDGSARWAARIRGG